jgi:DNA-binding transcriptional MocR family regulator
MCEYWPLDNRHLLAFLHEFGYFWSCVKSPIWRIMAGMKPNRFAEVLGEWTTKSGPLHHRLREAIEDAVEQGVLLPGMRLPAERSLAKALSVSRTTVVSAYDRLREAGLLRSKTGSGTFVSRKHATHARLLAHSKVVSQGSVLNLLKMNDPSLIDLAMATTEPMAEFVERAMARAAEHISYLIRQRNYMPFGLASLRKAIALMYRENGTPTSDEQILITTGAQQAISLITSLFVHRGDHVLAENPTYFGALEVFRFAGARLFPIPFGKEHVAPEALQRRIAAVQPCMVYLAPTCQNPTGVIMPTTARLQIARDAEAHEVPIIEDETLAELSFHGKRPLSISTYSASAPILTVGSLSKLICPALRIGWIRGPVPVITRLAKLKSAIDLGSSLITQAIATELFEELDEMRALRSRELRTKHEFFSNAIRSYETDWEFDEPQGGMSLWVRMPNVDTRLFAQLAQRHSVSVTPGNLFSIDESHSEYLRLPYLLDTESLAHGVEGLVEAWRETNEAAGARHMESAVV